MGSNIKIAADRLLKIADQLEKEAAENTFFVCDVCNHTASLADINVKRKTAGENHRVKRVANVTVNDEVGCVACGGKMSYVPTVESSKYYVESDDELNAADIFEPVDERNTDIIDEDVAPADEVSTEPAPEVPVDTESEDTTVEDAPGEKMIEDKTTEEIPSEDSDIADYDNNSDEDVSPDNMDEDTDADVGDNESVTTDISEEDTDPEVSKEDNPVVEETVGEDVSEDVSNKDNEDNEDFSGEEKVELPKEDSPKFEKIPKDASDPFWRSVAKYDV